MFTFRQQQFDKLSQLRWCAHRSRVESFLWETLGPAWIAKAEGRRHELLDGIIDVSKNIRLKRLSSVFKLAALIAASDAKVLHGGHVLAYLTLGDDPDLQLERLYSSLKVMQVVQLPAWSAA